MQKQLQNIQREHQAAVDSLFGQCSDTLAALAKACAASLKKGNKLLFCGNGGSACDAMHIAGEFVGRFVHDRPSLAAIALSADSGVISAIANDYGYDHVFSRQVEGLGKRGDILVALSTSGKSPNILAALKTAKDKGLTTALFTGAKAAKKVKNVDFQIVAPSAITAHVQEAHMVALHALAALIEARV